MDLAKLFNPQSVAVVGASADPAKVGYAILQNLLTTTIPRRIYPVNTKEGEILGQRVYHSLKNIEEPIDCVVIAIPAAHVGEVLAEAGALHVPYAVVVSAGFREIGEEGRVREDELRTIAHENGITLLGPNCLGFIDTHHDCNISFAAQKPLAGRIAFVSQSGALGTAFLDWAGGEGIGISQFVSLGNEAGLTEADLFNYLADDPATEAVIAYLEQVSDGPRFLAAAQRLAGTKPLVILKAGRSERGAHAIASHTGALASSADVFESAVRSVGAVSVASFRDMCAVAKIVHGGITKPARRIAILTNGGGPSVIATDLIDLSRSLEVATLTDATVAALASALPSAAAVKNPVDVLGDARADRYDAALSILGGDPNVDAIMVIVTPQRMTECAEIAKTCIVHRDAKPIIPVFLGGAMVAPGIEEFRANGVANFTFVADAVTALTIIGNSLPAKTRSVLPPPPLARSRRLLDFSETVALLGSYGLRLEGSFVITAEEARQAAAALGTGPFVLKAFSPTVLHKSDVGLVRVGLSDPDRVGEAWSEIEVALREHSPEAPLAGMVVQAEHRGRELIIGMKRDRSFGPVIVFGMGGIYTEIVHDVVTRVAPVDGREAERMMREIRGATILEGARGERPIDFEQTGEIIESLSRCALEHPEIEEIDLNPVIASADGAFLVDARIVVRLGG